MLYHIHLLIPRGISVLSGHWGYSLLPDEDPESMHQLTNLQIGPEFIAYCGILDIRRSPVIVCLEGHSARS
jgi:hypothetical protein